MPLLHFSSEQFLVLGLQLCGWPSSKIEKANANSKEVRFRAKYYASPASCEIIFHDIQETEVDVDGQATTLRRPNPRYFLMALFYLKKYPDKQDLADFLKLSEKTALLWAKRYVEHIQALKELKVRRYLLVLVNLEESETYLFFFAQIRWLFDNPPGETIEIFAVSVDGVHCMIWEPRRWPSSGWYTKKHNCAGLAYELGVAIWRNAIVWVAGPFPAGAYNDNKIFARPGGLKEKMIASGIRGVADEGYKGHPEVLGTRNAFDKADTKYFKGRVKARHESCNSRLKRFNILAHPFRGRGDDRLDKHKSAFEACCVVVQYDLEHGKGLFKV